MAFKDQRELIHTLKTYLEESDMASGWGHLVDVAVLPIMGERDDTENHLYNDSMALSLHVDDANQKSIGMSKALQMSIEDLMREAKELVPMNEPVDEISEPTKESQMLSRFKKMANRLDKQGHFGLADALDSRIKRTAASMSDATAVFNRIMTEKGWGSGEFAKELVLGPGWNELDEQVQEHMGLQAGKDYNNWEEMIAAMQAAEVAPHPSQDSGPEVTMGDPRITTESPGQRFRREQQESRPERMPVTPPAFEPSQPQEPMTSGEIAEEYAEELRKKYPGQVKPQMADDGKTAAQILRAKMANRLDAQGYYNMADKVDQGFKRTAGFSESVDAIEQRIEELNTYVEQNQSEIEDLVIALEIPQTYNEQFELIKQRIERNLAESRFDYALSGLAYMREQMVLHIEREEERAPATEEGAPIFESDTEEDLTTEIG